MADLDLERRKNDDKMNVEFMILIIENEKCRSNKSNIDGAQLDEFTTLLCLTCEDHDQSSW